MTKEHVAKAFSPFVQADSSTTRKFGGTGLGLSIVKSITEAMRGEIKLNSTPGTGTTFRVTIPLPTFCQADAIDTKEAAITANALSSPTSILVAEDNQTNSLILEAFLKRIGATASFVENGRDAVEAFKRDEFDIILMDINMPVMDGVLAFREIRKLEEKAGRAKTPIIAVTADAMDHQVRQYLDVGFDGHLPKPVNQKALLQIIECSLSRIKIASSKPVKETAASA